VPEPTPTNEIRYQVSGLTCGHCAAAVRTELAGLEGVREVHVDLVAGGTSTVTVVADPAPHTATVAAALAEAGDYALI
jgi:copper chaperone CopZ